MKTAMDRTQVARITARTQVDRTTVRTQVDRTQVVRIRAARITARIIPETNHQIRLLEVPMHPVLSIKNTELDGHEDETIA